VYGSVDQNKNKCVFYQVFSYIFMQTSNILLK